MNYELKDYEKLQNNLKEAIRYFKNISNFELKEVDDFRIIPNIDFVREEIYDASGYFIGRINNLSCAVDVELDHLLVYFSDNHKRLSCTDVFNNLSSDNKDLIYLLSIMSEEKFYGKILLSDLDI